MGTVNKVMLMGNLTRDPELRYTPQGTAVCAFALALNHSYTNKQTGQKVDEVTFVDVDAWGRTAEICAEYLKKGRSAFVEGRLKQDKWEGQDGKKMSKIKVVAERVTFVGSRPAGGSGAEAPAPPESASEEAAPPEDIPF
jgi:single-strand DNA-binding protein